MARKPNPAGHEAYYYNLETGQVERGYQSDWTDRIGPYATAEDAQNALARAKARNEEWDAADREWNDDDDPGDD